MRSNWDDWTKGVDYVDLEARERLSRASNNPKQAKLNEFIE